jgi:uncharacterized membrane protein
MKPQTVFMISGLVIGIAYLGLGIPLALKRISPNKLYGMRTRKTLSNPEIWYCANAFSGRWMMAAGLVSLLSALLLPYAAATLNLHVAALAILALAFEVLPIIVVVVASAIFVQKL